MVETIKPERVLRTKINGTDYTWEAIPARTTGLRQIALQNDTTGVRMLVDVANPDTRVAAHRAWLLARHSRAPGSTEQIASEMGDKGVDSDSKLEQTYANYGHMSVADSARTIVHYNNVPMHVPILLFYLGELNGAQEKSTRYQGEFSAASMHPLEHHLDEDLRLRAPGEVRALSDDYRGLAALAASNFKSQFPAVREALIGHFRPEPNQIKSLESRTLDTVRAMLLLGQMTGFGYEGSARDFSAKIAHLKSMANPFYRGLGEQMEFLLAPPKIDVNTDSFRLDESANIIELALGYKAEMPSLIRHTAADHTLRDNMVKLRAYLRERTDLLQSCPSESGFRGKQRQSASYIPGEFTAPQRMVAQYVTALFPGMDDLQALRWAKSAEREHGSAISDIVFEGHDHKHMLPQLASTTGEGMIFRTDIGAARDLNRHRAWGRHWQDLPYLWGLPMRKADFERFLDRGWSAAEYLDLPGLEHARAGFESDMGCYYEGLHAFVDNAGSMLGDDADFTFAMNLLPLGHRVNLWMHSNPRQENYFTSLRTADGGHITYRLRTWEALEQIRASSPYLGAMGEHIVRPDPASRQQFFSRK